MSLLNIQEIEVPCMTVGFFGGVFIKVILITFNIEGYYF